MCELANFVSAEVHPVAAASLGCPGTPVGVVADAAPVVVVI